MDILPFQELKREALTQRVNKLFSWLQRPEYAKYKNHKSTIRLVKLINLIIWALERSIESHHWEVFKIKFTAIRSNLLDKWENKEAEMATYYCCLAEIETALKSYLDFIKTNELIKTF